MKFSGRQKTMAVLAGVLVFLLLGLAGMIFLGKSPVDPIEIQNVHVDSQAALTIDGMDQISQKNGITQWELSARSASLIQKENKAILEKVHVIFYTKDKKQIRLTADHGQLHTLTHDIFLTDNVVITHETTQAKTHSLHYEKKNHIIRANSNIQLTDGYSVIQADSMVIELTDSRLILSGHVTGTVYEVFHRP